MVHQLYRCSRAPGTWPEALDGIAASLDLRAVALQWCRADGRRLQPLRTEVNPSGGEFHRRYLSEVSDSRNPRFAMDRLALNLGRLVRDEDIIPDRSERQRFRSALTPIGLGPFLGSVWRLADGTFLTLALHQAPDQPEPWTGPQRELLGEWLRHLEQVLEISASLQRSETLGRETSALLDLMPQGICLCGPDGRLDWANRGAQRLLDRQSPLRLVENRLRPLSAQDQVRLLQALEGGRETFLTFKGREEGPGWQACLRPIAREPRQWLLILQEIGKPVAISPRALEDLFHLTPAEVRLASALCQGSSIQDYAAARGLAVDTVRGQAKQVFSKTGTGRQAELVSLLFSSLACLPWRGAPEA
ncbi:MAG: putative transcription regulator protein [Holophagaceae bacterium]|nr:putative transcription regulator protein [Holophagaceae bacterium]